MKLSIAAKNRKRKPHTEETKQKMKTTWVKKIENGFVSNSIGNKHSDETKNKISESKIGIKRLPLTQEQKNKLSKSLSGKAKNKIWITNGVNNSMISKDIEIPLGWIKGISKIKK